MVPLYEVSLLVRRAKTRSRTGLLYRSKGKTELALAELGYSDTAIFRAGTLGEADRPEHRLAETCFMCVAFLDNRP